MKVVRSVWGCLRLNVLRNDGGAVDCLANVRLYYGGEEIKWKGQQHIAASSIVWANIHNSVCRSSVCALLMRHRCMALKCLAPPQPALIELVTAWRAGDSMSTNNLHPRRVWKNFYGHSPDFEMVNVV